ncbi:MAG TPA: sialate O-acetylesterase [Planctomycetota bacterium]|nr:sialate O-acetylesterase [Planctomycetota bacterium]
MLRLALLFPILVAASPALHAQGPLDGGPSAGRVVWLRGDHGVTRGLSDLVSNWRDEVSANEVANANPVTLPEWRAAAVNGQPALHFDGNDSLCGSGMPTGSTTKVAVCQLDTLGAANPILASNSGHQLRFAGSDRARLTHGTDVVTSTTGVPIGTPIVLVETYDETTGDCVLYQDGIQVGAGHDGLHGNGDSDMLLGSFGTGNGLAGSVAEVMGYDHVLSSIELSDLHLYLLRRYHGDPPPIVQLDLQPRPGQIFQRDSSDSAPVVFAGSVSGPTWTDLSLEITRNGAPFDTTQQPLDFASGSAFFQFTRPLQAGKYDYECSLYAVRGPEQRLIARIGKLAVGDVWLINGQSNAVAADYFYERLANTECQSPWVRSFGTTAVDGEADFDLHWDMAEGEDIYSHASVGAWGLRLGSLLEQNYGMPIALINGAVGGSSIAILQRDNRDPSNLRTHYGRLLYRARAAGVQDSVRGMLWYQGEADAQFAMVWRTKWQTLRRSWHIDYPALNQVYLFQIRDNCSGNGNSVREIQRELIDDSIDTYVMSTTAAPFHDGCHFYYAGYRELGDRLARVIGRDAYGSTDTQEIDPPNLLSAVWNDPQHSQILLTFRDPDDVLVFEQGAEANFTLDEEIAIQNGAVSGNTVLLRLASSSAATRISYDGHPGDGPWLKNARDVGALTFFDIPIH